MGCACSQSAKDDIGISHSDPQELLYEERSCTDVCFLMLFAAFWVGMIIVGINAFGEGNTNRILYGLDMYGNTCGTNDSSYSASSKPDFTDRKNLYWLHILLCWPWLWGLWLDVTEFFNISDPSTMKTVCLGSCPTDVGYGSAPSMPCTQLFPQYKLKAVLLKFPTCVDTSTFVCLYDKKNGWKTDYYDTLSDDEKSSSQNGDGPCYRVLLRTYPILNKCFPRPPDTVANMSAKHDVYVPSGNNKQSSQAMTSAADVKNLDTGQLEEVYHGAAKNENSTTTDAEKMAVIYDSFTKQFSKARLAEYLADVWKGYLVILVCGMGGGIAVSFVWIGLMRCCSGLVTWTTIVLINFAVLGFTLFCYIKAGNLASSGLGKLLAKETGPLPSVFDPSTANKKVFEVAAYVMTGATAGTIILSWFMRKRISVAIACMKVASSAIGSMPCLLFFPLVPFVLCTMLVIWVLVVAVYLYSAGQVVAQEDGGYKVQWDYMLRYMAIFHLFGLLWTWQFIQGIGDVVIAGTVSLFYWQRGEPVDKPLCTSLRRAFLYHLGSVALGSFIIAVLQFIRLIFEYMKSKTKPMTDGMVVARFVLGMVRCFLRAVETILTLVNRNAYIMVAIKGTNYCSSAGHALALMLKNVLRFGAVNVISGILIFVGQLMIGLTCGVAAFAFCEWKPYSDPASRRYLSSPLSPVLCSTVIGYFVAQIFLQVYDMSIDTIMLCFCEDCNMNYNRPVCAPTVLMDALGLKGDIVPVAADLPEIRTMPREEAPPTGPRLKRSLSR